ncbi:MAG: hypothetical protein FJW81_09390 [Actinobacteria bacterium]|nr:hypothetical protein [Actinomycetota bacterium]
MKGDAIVAGVCAGSYAATGAWALFGGDVAPPYDLVVGVKDAMIAGLCLAWVKAELDRGPLRARGIALVAALVILADAFLALAGGVGPWRTEIIPDGSLAGSLVVGVGLIALGLGLVWFVRRPDPPAP